jgi:hypothetical protein
MDWGSLPNQRFKTNKSATDYANSQVEIIKSKNHDGFFVTILEDDNIVEIVAFEPNQIKLANGTNTTFDGNNSDIRFDGGGGIEKIKFDIEEDYADGGLIDDKVGKEFWFEYHCLESHQSCDAEIWYHSHQKVKVLSVVYWGFDELQDRREEGDPRVYSVKFNDGFIADVFEDELMESKDEFYRPEPPNTRYTGGGLMKRRSRKRNQ